MSILKSRYNTGLFLLACAVWSYPLSLVFAKPFWFFLIGLRIYIHLDVNTTSAILGGTVLMLTIATCGSVLLHFLVVTVPSLRARFRPRVLGHFAAFAIMLLAYSSVTTISSRPFPYFPTHSQAQRSQNHEHLAGNNALESATPLR